MTDIELINGSVIVVKQSLSELQNIFYNYDSFQVINVKNKQLVIIRRHDIVDLRDHESLIGR